MLIPPHALEQVGRQYSDWDGDDYRAQDYDYGEVAQSYDGFYLVLYPAQKNWVAWLPVVREGGQKE